MELIEQLPTLQRLALAYAPAASRDRFAGLLALDTRMASIVRASSEPMMAQLRLTWWRETLSRDSSEWPTGEPILASLAEWNGAARALSVLAEGWEEFAVASPLDTSAIEALAKSRGEAFAALADLSGARDAKQEVSRVGSEWAIADVASRLGAQEERACALELMRAQDWRPARLPRVMRPLAVLHGLARRSARSGRDLDELPRSAILGAVRVGLFGR